MKNLLILLLVVFGLYSCRISLEKIQSKPEKWSIYPVLILDWDGNYPANRWSDTIEFDKPYVTYNKVPYVIREITVQDGDSTKKMIVIESYMDETYKLERQRNR